MPAVARLVGLNTRPPPVPAVEVGLKKDNDEVRRRRRRPRRRVAPVRRKAVRPLGRLRLGLDALLLQDRPPSKARRGSSTEQARPNA